MNLVPSSLPDFQGPPSIEAVRALQHYIGQMPQVDIPVTHHFAQGLYVREITVPKGTVFVGKMHAKEHVLIIAQGDMTIWTEAGMTRVKAPFVWASKVGAKRCGYAHEDTVMITAHPTTETNLEKLEAELIVSEGLPGVPQ